LYFAALTAISGAALLAFACAFGCAGADEGGTAIEHANHTAPEPWFVEITTSSGLLFTHESGATGDRHMPEIMGPGAAMFDYDNDGDLDIYLINGAFSFAQSPTGEQPRNQLFRQDDGLQFRNVTDESGLGDTACGMGAAIGDIDNDGWLDVYVTNYGPDQLFRNRGDGSFENITERARVNVPGWSCSAAFLDFDRDGFLDLYVTQYVQYRPALKCSDMAGRPDYCGPKSFPPATDVLLRNNGDGTFSDVSRHAGIDAVAGAGLGVVCADFDSDGWIDVYVANDAYANNLWLNQRDGTFVDVANAWGCALNAQGQREAGMGVVAADLDGDLLLDLFITHLANETNTMYRGERRGAARSMSDVTVRSGLGASSAPFTGFGVIANDLDLDGALDLIVVNGRVVRAAPLAGAQQAPPWNAYAEPNLVYINDGGGEFELLGAEGDGLTGLIEISRGLCTGDVDRDGRVDILITNTQDPARLYLNKAPRRGRWLSLRAVDPRYQRDAIGASLLIECGEKSWLRTVIINDSYVSASDVSVHVGLGQVDTVDRVTVTWPDGRIESFSPDCVDCAIQLVRGEGEEVLP
jgi:hypothetical protein